MKIVNKVYETKDRVASCNGCDKLIAFNPEKDNVLYLKDKYITFNCPNCNKVIYVLQ